MNRRGFLKLIGAAAAVPIVAAKAMMPKAKAEVVEQMPIATTGNLWSSTVHTYQDVTPEHMTTAINTSIENFSQNLRKQEIQMFYGAMPQVNSIDNQASQWIRM